MGLRVARARGDRDARILNYVSFLLFHFFWLTLYGVQKKVREVSKATEARRGYARVAAWDEGNLIRDCIQAMAHLKNPTSRSRGDMEMDEVISYQ